MSARTILISAAPLLLLAVLAMDQPTALEAADQGDGTRGLADRVAALEKTVKTLSSSRELDFLKSRVADLERQSRDHRLRSSSGVVSSSSSNEISQLKRANAELKRSLGVLEGKVSTERQSTILLRRDINSLRLQVSTLQSEVERLKR